MNPPKCQARRTTQATFPAQEYPPISQKVTPATPPIKTAWEDRTQATNRSTDSTLLEPTIPLNIQRLLEAVTI